MKPVRSRSCSYGQLAVSVAREATGLSAAMRRLRGVEKNVVGAAGEPDDGVVLGRRHHETLDTDDVVVETREVRRSFVGRDPAPQLGPEPDDEIHSADGGSRLAQRGDQCG